MLINVGAAVRTDFWEDDFAPIDFEKGLFLYSDFHKGEFTEPIRL